MKHLKTFENFNTEPVNEGELRKFFTGHDSKEDKEKAKKSILDKVEEIDLKVKENPKAYSFNKSKILAEADANNYRGNIREINKNGILYVNYNSQAAGAGKTGASSKGKLGSPV